jgi:hypothetical protein
MASTAAPPYVVPSAPGVEITPVLTVGDAVPEADAPQDHFDSEVRMVNGVVTHVPVPQDGVYRMVGIPDGLGAFDNAENRGRGQVGDDDGDNGFGRGGRNGGTFTVLMNHELSANEGAVRDHGATGAFVSRWVLRKSDLTVISGDDQIKQVLIRNPATGGYEPAVYAFNRLCSADLAKPTAFFDPETGRGTRDRLFLDGEETRPPNDPRYGKAFAHVVTGPENGNSYELADVGEMSFENVVASPFPQRKTIVVALDDSTNRFTNGTPPADAANPPSEVYVYVGEKTKHGNPIERAGLTGGSLSGVRVLGKPSEPTVVSGDRFELTAMSDAAQAEGFALQTEAISKQVTQFRRVEDGHWDPSHPRDFYFVTTDQFAGQTRLWRLRFDDITRPERGGRIDIMYDSPAGVPGEMFDNITIDGRGRVLIQEDPGNNPYLAKIHAFNTETRVLKEVAQSNPALFGVPPVKTVDEEHSGIIDVSDILGPGTFLFDTQAHLRLADPELVEDGQVLSMTIDFSKLRDGDTPVFDDLIDGGR